MRTLALALAIAGAGCSLMVDLDKIRPGAGSGDGGIDAGGAEADAEPGTLVFDHPSLFGEEQAILYEGVGTRMAYDPTMTELLPIGSAPIPIAIRGLLPQEDVEVEIPPGIPNDSFLCGQPIQFSTTFRVSELDPPCGVFGPVAVVTISIAASNGLAPPNDLTIEFDVLDTVGGVRETFTSRVVALDELMKVDAVLPPRTGRFSAIVIAAGTPAQFPADKITWESASDVLILADLDSSGRDASSCSSGATECDGGEAGNAGAGAGGGTPCADVAACSGGGVGAGGGVALCTLAVLPSGTTADGGAGGAGSMAALGGAGQDGTMGCPAGGTAGILPAMNPRLAPLPDGGSGGGAGASVLFSGVTALGGAGGGGGGTIAIEALGLIFVGPTGRLGATGGIGGAGQTKTSGTNTLRGGRGGGGSGGAIRLLADAITFDPTAELDARGSSGQGADGGQGQIRVDGRGASAIGLPNSGFVGPVFVMPPPAVVNDGALRLMIDAGSAADGSIAHAGVRRAGDTEYDAVDVALDGGTTTGTLAADLRFGLNEVCLFARQENSLVVADIPPTLRRCAWIAYHP